MVTDDSTDNDDDGDNSTTTILDVRTEDPLTIHEQKLYIKEQNRVERRIIKAKLSKLMGRVRVKRRKRSNKKSHATNTTRANKSKAMIQGNIRTLYELKFESYLKLLDIPFVIDSVFCFRCNNFYYYGNNEYIPKTCMVCMEKFYDYKDKKAYMARPDFILDFNNDDLRLKYKQQTQHHQIKNINSYKEEYFKKIGIVRIDGSIHNKQSIKIKDYNQYRTFIDQGIKVFIVTNDDIDALVDLKDNGKELLALCHRIGDATLDESKYAEYCQDLDFQERVRRPF